MKYEKSPGATTNTYHAFIKGISTNINDLKYQNVNVKVMFTSDEHSETLSFYDPISKRQVTVPFGEVESLINYVRKGKDNQ